MANVFLLNYNNYYNRQIKVLQTINDYLHINSVVAYSTSTNFINGDGVNTTHVWNEAVGSPNLVVLQDSEVNYLIVTDDEQNIVSRWFILDKVELRKGQYRLELKRDLIADAYQDILSAPMFIEKATLTNDNPLIFNSENMSFNQIKTRETLLDDSTHTPWIVGYLSHQDGEGSVFSLNGNIVFDSNADISLTSMSSSAFLSQYNNKQLPISNALYKIYTSYGNQNVKTYNVGREYFTLGPFVQPITNTLAILSRTVSKLDAQYRDLFSTSVINELNSKFNIYNQTINLTESEILNYNGKTVLFSDGLYKISTVIKSTAINQNIPQSSGDLYITMKQIMTDFFTQNSDVWNLAGSTPFGIVAEGKQVKITLEKVASSATSYSYSIPTTRRQLLDSPYDMFCIPYNDCIFNKAGGGSVLLDKNISRAVAAHLGTNPSQLIYDIQILPYCPVLAAIQRTNGIGVVGLDENIDFTYIKDSNNNIASIILFAQFSSFKFSRVLDEPVVITEPKISNECDLYRLCSPNYSGVFEFSAAKNQGISYFNVYCTYKPYNPYIHLAPDFKGLYGQNYDDGRGLTCGGDFSYARVTDAWKNYELNNKNYQAIFDRQIQSMEFKNNVGLAQDIVGAMAGTAQGAAAGSLLGPAGAAVGGVISGAAGIADIAVNQKLRQESLDYTKDMYGYNLGNIKALPQSISKTTAYTLNNKYYPFLEYYTCSAQEKEALRNKLKYNGMTVMAIGSIQNYLQTEETYIKGKLIRLDNSNYDTHYVQELSNELYMGVFISTMEV